MEKKFWIILVPESNNSIEGYDFYPHSIYETREEALSVFNYMKEISKLKGTIGPILETYSSSSKENEKMKEGGEYRSFEVVIATSENWAKVILKETRPLHDEKEKEIEISCIEPKGWKGCTMRSFDIFDEKLFKPVSHKIEKIYKIVLPINGRTREELVGIASKIMKEKGYTVVLF